MPGWEALRRAAGLLQPHEAALRRPAAAAAAARPYHGRTSGSGGGAFAASAFWGPSSRQLPSLQPDAPLPPQQILPPKPWGLCQASTVHEPCRFRAEAPKDGEASCSDRALHMQKLRQEALHSAVSHQRGKGGDAVACQEFHQLLVELGIPEFRAQHLVERLSSSARGIPEVESTARPVLEFLRARDIKAGALRRIVCDRPGILGLGVAVVMRKIDFLHAIGVRPSALGAALEKAPSLLEAPIYEIGKVHGYLSSVVGVDDALLPFLLERFPALFLSPPEDRLMPLLAFLEEKLGMTSRRVAQVVKDWPQVLMFSPEDLQPQLDALRDLGMGNDDIRDVYHAAPSVMALDVDMQMKPAIAFLQENGLKGDNLCTVLRSEPQILQLNLTVMPERSKLQHLTQVMGRSIADLHECPQYLTSRLSKMAPRAAFLSMLGHDPKALALRDVVVGADREWARDVAGVDASEYFRFKEEYMEAQAEAEYQSGEWDYFFRSSMP